MASKWPLTKKESINSTLKYEERFLFEILKSYKYFLYPIRVLLQHLSNIVFPGFKWDNAFRKHFLFHLHPLFSKTLNNRCKLRTWHILRVLSQRTGVSRRHCQQWNLPLSQGIKGLCWKQLPLWKSNARRRI